MKEKDANRLQGELFDYLEDYFLPKGFKYDRKEWDIIRNYILLPFFVNSLKYDSFTIKPMIWYFDEELMAEMNQFLGEDNKQFYNSIFKANNALSNYFGVNEFDEVEENNYDSKNWNYEYKISSTYEIRWVGERVKNYMEKVGWKLLDHFKNQETIFTFFKQVFLDTKNVETKFDPTIFELDGSGLITMIYLGFKMKKEGIDELVEDISEIYSSEESLVAKSIVDIYAHFGRVLPEKSNYKNKKL